jgi:hypothetical protein
MEKMLAVKLVAMKASNLESPLVGATVDLLAVQKVATKGHNLVELKAEMLEHYMVARRVVNLVALLDKKKVYQLAA